MDKLQYNHNAGWLCQIWTMLVAAARLPGMSDSILLHYALRAIKHSSLVPVYESTPIELVHSLGDCCWTEIAFLVSVLDSCIAAFGANNMPDYQEYIVLLLNDLDEQMRGWEDWPNDYLPLLEDDYHG